MAALGVTLLVMALVLVLAEAHLSTGGLIGAGVSMAGIAGVVACRERSHRRPRV
jgi:membrane-bound ClpP family serine protease